MATNAKWRQPLKVWERTFSDWIERPTPESLHHAGIFFDLDGVWGKTAWANRLRELIARKARGNSRFLACMARNALQRTPPLGFFKGLRGRVRRPPHRRDQHQTPRHGAACRSHPRACAGDRSESLNSFERLKDIIDAAIPGRSGRGQDLFDALEFISMVRARHQAESLAAGEEPDNSIDPEKLSEFERKSRDAFLILGNAQKFPQVPLPARAGELRRRPCCISGI